MSERDRILLRTNCAPGEDLDYTPVEVPVGAGKPESFQEMMQRFAQNAIAGFVQAQQEEPAEEEDIRALNLDTPDPEDLPDITTGYTVAEMTDGHPTLAEVSERMLQSLENPSEDLESSEEGEDEGTTPRVDKKAQSEAEEV